MGKVRSFIRKPAILLLITLVGCSGSCESDSSKVSRMARKYVDGWTTMGMWLPKKQVPFFAAHFSQVKDVLANALKHSNPDVRQRAAYVVEELGRQAALLESHITQALESESERLVRIYLYNALRAVGASDRATIATLRRTFELLAQEQSDSPEETEYYNATDERIYVASALYVLDDRADQRSQYLYAVLWWLKPSKADLKPKDLQAYWDRRWCAVNAVEHMDGAKDAIPLLEAMLSEQSKKPWVSFHVPRAIKALRSSNGP